MLASSPFFSTFGWPLEDPIIHNINYDHSNIIINNKLNRETETFDDSPISKAPIGQPGSDTFCSTDDNPVVEVKRLNHNLSERDRRKRINGLYSSLFSLLPATDQMKKQSIPSAVLRMVEYIPVLQKEVEELIHKKEELTSRISSQKHENSIHAQNKRRRICNLSNENTTTNNNISSSFVSTTQISDNELMVQISTIMANKYSLVKVLQALEENGLILLNASSFQSCEARVFHNLHFQVPAGTKKMDRDLLRDKILSIYEMREQFLF